MKKAPPLAYSPREGYTISKADAQRLGAAVAALERSLRRAVTPADLIEAGRDEDSPFHGSFTWDDAQAAHERRLEQARYLLRAINVTLPQFDNATVRGFIPASYGPNDDGFLSTSTAIVKRPDVVRLQLRRLRDEATRIEADYAGWAALIEFEPGREFVQAAGRLAKSPA